MRILVWSEAFWPTVGGVEMFLTRLTQHVSQRGHLVHVVAAHSDLDLPDEDALAGIRVDRIRLFEALQSRRPEEHLRLRRRISSLVSGFRPDLLHLNLLGPGAALFDAVDRRTTSRVVTLHAGLDTLRSGGPDTLLGRTVAGADWITACSQAALDRVVQLSPAAAAISSVIPYGVNVTAEPPGSPHFDPPHLLCVGRLVTMKAFDVAIDALARVRLAGHSTACLTIAGDGPERAALEAQACNAGLDGCVHFVGWCSPDEVRARMLDASLVVMPSRASGVDYSEGLGIVALEAAEAGRAVVASRAGGLPEAVVDGVTGIIVQPDDSDALARAIGSLLADPARATALGAAGRRRIQSRFRWDTCLDAYVQLFIRLADGRTAQHIGVTAP
ncbi:MAG: glycosyltransferase family 4 protein [Vicinamibacterales bacterium]